VAEIAIREAWDKLPGESRQSFHGFSTYRDLGPTRSLAQVATALGKSATAIEKMSAKYDWVARAEAFDWHRDQIRQQEIERLEREAVDQQRALGQALRITSMQRLVGRRPGVSGDGRPLEEIVALDPNDLNAQDVARLAVEGVRIERLAMGMPTDVSKAIDTFTLREVRDLVETIVEAALERMPEAEHEGYVRFVREIGQTRSNGRH